MDELLVKSADENSLLARIEALEKTIKNTLERNITGSRLDFISDDMGVQMAGEFRTGEGEPGNGFSGVRMGYPSFEYGGYTWHLVGVYKDRLMFGLNAEDGSALFAGGKGTIGDNGIEIEGLLNAILQKATGGWADGEEETRYGTLGMFLPDGSKKPAFGMELTDDVSGDPVISNGLFDTGDLTGWDPSLGESTLFGVVEDKLPTYVDGFVLESQERPDVTDEETLTGISSDVVAGDMYNFSLWTRDDYIVTDIETNENLNIDESNPDFAQGGLTDFGTHAWLEAGYYTGQTEQRTLLRFDENEAENITVVDEAGLVYYIRKSGLTLGTVPLSIRYLLTDWDWETATWNESEDGISWDEPGAKGEGTDVSADIVGTDSIVAANTEEGYRYTDIAPAIIQDWLDGAINFYGLMMTGTTLSGNNALDIGLKEKEVGAFLRISERPVYKVEVEWWTGSGATGTLVRVDNIASNNDIPSWNERKAVLTVPTGAVSFAMVITATRGKLFQMSAIVIKRLGISTRMYLGPDARIQDDKGIRRILSTYRELVKPTAASAGFVAGTITQGDTISNGDAANTGSPKTVSHTVDAGSDVVLIVAATSYSSTAGRTISGVTWDGDAMTLLGSQRSGDNRWGVYLWGIKLGDVASDTTANIVMTPSGTGTYFGGIATNYYNVDQTDTYGTANGAATAGATSISATITTEDQDMVVASAVDYDSGSPVCGNTSDGRNLIAGSLIYYCASHETASDDSTDMSWSGTSVLRAIVGIPLKPLPASGNVDEGDHYYGVTFIDEFGETEMGDASSVVTVPAGGGSVNLLSIPTGQYGTIGRKIYRTKADGSVFFMLATIDDNTTTDYEDTIADADLYNIIAPLTNNTSSRPQFPRSYYISPLSLLSNATITNTASGVAILSATSAANANDGDYFETSLWIEEGTYILYVHGRLETTAGKVDIYIDEVLTESGVDFYGASAATLKTITDVAVIGSGYHKIKFVINDKNASSSDFTFNFYSATFTPAAY